MRRPSRFAWSLAGISAGFLLLSAGVPRAQSPPAPPSPRDRLIAAIKQECGDCSQARQKGDLRGRERWWLRRLQWCVERIERHDLHPSLLEEGLAQYYFLLEDIGPHAAAQNALLPHVARLGAALAREQAVGSPDAERVDHLVWLARVRAKLLYMIAASPGADAFDRQRALACVPGLLTLRDRHPDAGYAVGLQDNAKGILARETRHREAEGRPAAARETYARYQEIVACEFDFRWRQRYRPWADRMQHMVQYCLFPWEARQGMTPFTGSDRFWLGEVTAAMRARLHGMVRSAEAGTDPVRAVEARWLLAGFEYGGTDSDLSSMDAAFHEAQTALDAAAALPDGPHRTEARYRTARLLGVIAAMDGDLATARMAWTDALARAREDRSADAVARRAFCLAKLAESEISFGFMDAALRHLREAERLLATPPALARGIEPIEEHVCAALARLHQLLGDTSQAKRYYLLARDPHGAARAPIYEWELASLARARFEAEGDPAARREERAHLLRALTGEAGSDSFLHRYVWQARARLRELDGRIPAAITAWEQASAINLERQYREPVAWISLAVGDLLLRSRLPDRLERAHRRFGQARDYAESVSHSRLQWPALVGLGRVAEQRGNWREALRRYEEAAQRAELLRERSQLSPEALARLAPDARVIYHLLVRLLLERRDVEEAYGWARRYKARVLRQILAGGADIKATGPAARAIEAQAERVRAARRALGALASRRLAGAPGAETAASEPRLAEARRNYETARNRLRELSVALPALPALPEPPLVSVADLQALAAAEGITLVDFLLTDTALLTFVIDRTGLHVLPARQLVATDLAWQARQALRICSSVAGDVEGPSLRRLYQALIAPLRPYLPPGRPVVIVPDGPLHGLPFAALRPPAERRAGDGGAPLSPWDGGAAQWPRSGQRRGPVPGGGGEGLAPPRFLIEERPVAIAPSLDVLYHSFRRPSAAGSANVLARSHRGRSAPVQVSRVTRASYGTLLAAPSEASAVARLLPARLWTERHADRRRFFRALGAKVLWFTGHVHYDPHDPANSAVLLARGGANDPLSVRDLVEALPQPRPGLDLAVLSGCDSTRGAPGAGEGLVGLAWALQRAGARSVVGCGWKVDDRATADLMVAFAENLRTMDRAEALRQAQLRLLRGGRYAHPYYWAAPVLLGRTDALGPITPSVPALPARVDPLVLLGAAGIAGAAGFWACRRRRTAPRRGA